MSGRFNKIFLTEYRMYNLVLILNYHIDSSSGVKDKQSKRNGGIHEMTQGEYIKNPTKPVSAQIVLISSGFRIISDYFIVKELTQDIYSSPRLEASDQHQAFI